MRKLTLALALFGVTSVALAGSLRSEINAVNAKIHRAMMNRDIGAFKKAVQGGITDDFKYVENGQSMSFDQMVDGMKQGFDSLKKVSSATSRILSLKQSGNNATAKTRHSMSGVMVGQDKKAHTLTFTGVSTDVFRREGGKWKMASMTWVSQKMTMDGKPFDPSKMESGGDD